MDKDKKPFHKGNRKPFHKDRKGTAGGRFKRKLEPGVEFEDRRLGVGIVRKVTEDGITVAFGDVEKVIPRKKRTTAPRERRPSALGKPLEKKVFTFDVQPGDKKPFSKDRKVEKREPEVGLEVVDETLGKGVVSRITERGVYVTYEATGEHVMYPRGLPSKLLKSAFPEVKKEKKAEPHKGKERTYKVPEQVKPEKKEKIVPHRAKETHRGNTRFISLGEGTLVISPLYGEGIIMEISNGRMIVKFTEVEKEYTYPAAFAAGEIEVLEKEDKEDK